MVVIRGKSRESGDGDGRCGGGDKGVRMQKVVT